MKKVYQTSFHDPVEGTRGNCMRACIASLLEKTIKEVPPLPPTPNQFSDALDYLDKYGWEYDCNYMFYHIAAKDREKELLLKLQKEEGIDGYFLVYGMSPRGVKHIVLYNKQGLAHDPHPSQSGVQVEGTLLFKKKPSESYGFNPFS